MTPGQQLRKAREARSMTQQALADLLGVNDSTVTRWESESKTARKPDRLNARLLEEILGLKQEVWD